MKTANLFAALLFTTGIAFCELRKNPDENTLWIEDGKALSGWKDTLKMTENPEGGLFIEKGSTNTGGRYVPSSPDYPWLVMEITDIEHTVDKYADITFPGLFNMIGNPMPGIFAVKMDNKDKSRFLRIDCHGLKVSVKYMKAVKMPDNFIETSINGTDLDVLVHLKEEAEDVSITYYDAYCMPRLTIDNSMKLQLYPVDKANPVIWKGTVKNFQNKAKTYLMLKATVLGGSLKTPLWGVLPKK